MDLVGSAHDRVDGVDLADEVDMLLGPSAKSTQSTLSITSVSFLPLRVELQAATRNALKERDYLVRSKSPADLNR